jgi:hypothetical protein
MRLSELYAQVLNAGAEVMAFPALLAEPDLTPGDDVDVLLSEIGWVEVDDYAGEVRLYPKSAVTEETPDQSLFCVERLLEQLPFDVSDDISETADLRIVVELPLLRDGFGLLRRALTDVCAVHIGRETEELWLLVRPTEDYPKDQLPA